MATKRAKSQKDKIVETFREQYALPFYKALRDHNPDAERLCVRIHDFKLGVHLSNPQGHWESKFNAVCDELSDLVGIHNKEDV